MPDLTDRAVPSGKVDVPRFMTSEDEFSTAPWGVAARAYLWREAARRERIAEYFLHSGAMLNELSVVVDPWRPASWRVV